MTVETQERELQPDELASLQVLLGLGTDGVELRLGSVPVPLDANPWTADILAARVRLLGHHDKVPRSYDWENLVAMLEPEEELILFVDYKGHEREDSGEVEVNFAFRFSDGIPATPDVIQQRRRRFEAFVSSFRRQVFPESEVEPLDVHKDGPRELIELLGRDDLNDPVCCRCITGVPSPKDLGEDERYVKRDEDSQRNYQSLNDVVETCIELKQPYRLAFVVMRVSERERAEEAEQVHTIWNALHPLIKQTMNDQQAAVENWSKSVAENTVTGGSQQAPDVALGGLGRGAKKVFNLFRWLLNKHRKKRGRPERPLKETSLQNRTWSQSTTKTTTSGRSTSHTRGITRETLDSEMMLAEKTLKRYGERLYEARGSGAYRAGVFIFARQGDVETIARATKAVLSGSQTCDRPFEDFPVIGPAAHLFQTRLPALPFVGEAAPILSLDQACQMLLLPEAELPGLKLRRSVFLGRNARPANSRGADLVDLGPDAFWAESSRGGKVQIEYHDLMRHLLIAGATGSGKTIRAVEILNGLKGRDDLQIVAFETAKGVYRHKLCRGSVKPLVYTVGDGRVGDGRFRPLRLNPFHCDCFPSADEDAPPRAPLKRHIAILSDALTELMPTEALIGPKLREAVESCYRDLGWDIERGEWTGHGPYRFPDGMDFVIAVRRIAAALNYGPEVNANYRGALEGRAQLFLQDTYRDLFMPTGGQDLDDLLPRDRDIIFETESLPPGELNIPAFLLSILVSRLREAALQERRRVGSADLKFRRLLVIEEAHNVLSREHEEKRDSRESQGERTLLMRLSRLLAEGREIGLGVMVVEQSPSMLARAVIANTGTKIVMRLEDGAEIEEMGRSLCLVEEAWGDLGLLQQGEGIVKASFMTQPVKSSRYLELSEVGGPDTEERGRAASYLQLSRLWSQALDGELEASWQEQLDDASNGDALIAAAAGVLALLDDESDPSLEDPIRHAVREDLRRIDAFAGLEEIAQRLARQAIMSNQGAALWHLSRRFLGAAWPDAQLVPVAYLDFIPGLSELLCAEDPDGAGHLYALLHPGPRELRQEHLSALGLVSDETLVAAVLAVCPMGVVRDLWSTARNEGTSRELLALRAREVVEANVLGLFDAQNMPLGSIAAVAEYLRLHVDAEVQSEREATS